MIYLLSDQHGGECYGDLQKYLDTATDDDLLIILGDLGLRFQDTEENRRFDEFVLSANKKIALVDGNHENFDYLYSFPEEELYGGMVHRITENLVHLERGYIYTIQGKTFFTFGGCVSGAKWKPLGLWYPEEAPTEEELARAYENREKYRRKVDYILVHKYDTGIGPICPPLFDLCRFIDEDVEFKHFYAGHWHKNMCLDSKHTFVYDKFVRVE